MFNDGVININKPQGWTSQDVCAKLRNRLKIRKIGHTGTLDPMATGVLPICIGKATRIIEYYDKDLKTYHSIMQLGIVTDTLDITGKIIESKSFDFLNDDIIYQAFRSYQGTIKQVPPKYSALKINGKRAYELARDGKDVKLSSREVFIKSNTVESIDWNKGTIEFSVTCSKGTYIRTICDDIGRELGCGAAMKSLIRTESGYFNIKESTDILRLIEMSDEKIKELIIPMERTLFNLGKILLDDNRVVAFQNGNSSSENCFKIIEDSKFCNLYKIYFSDKFIGVGEIKKGEIYPIKVIM
ncbi:MAG: tRNA pseudouridine(55) synthase TruB [Clostridiales bacterium]|nr:tRNA pseudouridine(55) synthase TruB [Clostridiales bacterium]